MNISYPRIILAGTHSGVGKTTIATGIMLALKKRGLKVQPFKAGPDYIDPSYHTQALGRVSRNLDSWMLSKDVILELFERQARKVDISIIEGVMGLYDGLGDSEDGSTAQLAKILNSPVILIVDAAAMSRSAGAVVLGYKKFDKGINIKGVILNNTGGPAHYNIPVVGFLPRDEKIKLPERHLGLIPTDEKRIEKGFSRRLLNLIERNIDIERLIKIACDAPSISSYRKSIFNGTPNPERIVVGVARDEAFNFYYEDNLDILRHLGVRLIEFSPLYDRELPRYIDGLYIGGGFPEIFASQLSKNIRLKYDIYKKAKDGLPIYAECGGLMYLMKEIEGFPMVGIFNSKVKMGNRLQRFGYVEIETLEDNILSKKGDKNKGHLFHWSYIKGAPLSNYMKKGNVLASYVHLHFASNISLAKNFMEACCLR